MEEVIITTNLIDAAWKDRYKEGYGAIHLKARLLGIDPCEECGGTGEDSRMGLFNPRTGEYERINIEECPVCHGHGWRIK